jgi:RNA polymerase sigma-70 factor (ECF subfamily)
MTAASDERAPPKTLGDVLYANQDIAVDDEREWVVLVEATAAGDQRAFRALFERMNGIVFTLTMRITQSREIAEEVMVDVFHDVWNRAATYDAENGTVVGWIANQARSRAIDRFRFEHRIKRTPPVVAVPELAESDAVHHLDVAEQGHLLREALRALTAEERQAIETAFFADVSYAEAAALLDQPVGTIKTRIRSGLRKLRRVLTYEVQS